jgi:DNA repair protein RecN (Recombination protein N)
MLLELEVRDYAIIDHLRVRFTPGFNVVTGETGAGKSILVGAMGLLVGERADTDSIRAGAERAVVDGVFDVGAVAPRVRAVLDAYGLDLGADLIVSREVHAAGRSTARVNGRPVPVRALVELGELLVDLHGQSENATLKREPEHLELLDRYADLGAPRAELAARVAREAEVRAEHARLLTDTAERARRAERLAFEVEEIEAARLSEAEEAALLAERHRLANAERLAVLAGQAYAALQGGVEEGPAALDALDGAAGALDELARIDPVLGRLHDQLLNASAAVADAAREVRDYRDNLEFSPERRQEVEERLALLSDLKRKYGAELGAVLAHAAAAAEELAALSGSEARTAQLEAERAELLAQIGTLAGSLSERRRAAGGALAEAVQAQLAELGLPGCRFEVSLERRPDPEGAPLPDGHFAFDATGVDRVSFLVSMNPGEPPRPLARIASGGETARLMLALKGVLSAADDVPTLIFDEIDTGVGGRVGAVVGRKLWGLADRHQVLCVTHLAQVAAFGDTHLTVAKAVEGGRTRTQVAAVTDAARVDELMHMLGPASDIARANAGELLEQSGQWKLQRRAVATP